MAGNGVYPRINIYLADVAVRRAVKVAAARQGVTMSAYCLQAIRRQLAEEGLVDERPTVTGRDRPAGASTGAGPLAAARALDTLRRRIGPLGVPVAELVADGRGR